MHFFFPLFFILLLSACSGDKGEIIELLEARDASISQQDIKAYSRLLTESYLIGEGKSKVSAMESVFQRFDAVKMQSRDREIRILDDEHAICEQTYLLRVLADKDWREVVQREQLKLELTQGQWKISGGL